MDNAKFICWVIFCVLTPQVQFSTSYTISNKSDDWVSEVPDHEKVISPLFLCPAGPDRDFPHEVFCEKFYRCVKQVSTLMSCRTDLNVLFNDLYGDCDFAYNVHCGNRTRPEGVSQTIMPPPPTTTTTKATTTPTTTTTTTTTTTPTPTTPSYETFNCTDNGTSPHPKYCEMYIECFEGIATFLRCPNNTLFQIQYLGCAPPDQVDCGTRIDPGKAFQCPIDGEDGELYSDPADCSAFYICTHGTAVHQYCSPGLYFNKHLSVCDYRQNVDCTNRGNL